MIAAGPSPEKVSAVLSQSRAMNVFNDRCMMDKQEDEELNAIADVRLKDGKKLVQVKMDEL